MISEKLICTHQWGNNETHDEYTSTNGMIVGNYNHSIDSVNALVAEAFRDFSGLAEDRIEVGIVIESDYNKGCLLIRFALPENTVHPDYRSVGRIDFRIT